MAYLRIKKRPVEFLCLVSHLKAWVRLISINVRGNGGYAA